MSDRFQASNLRREALIQQLEELQQLRDRVRRAEARLAQNAPAPDSRGPDRSLRRGSERSRRNPRLEEARAIGKPAERV
jgi:hypothetical protein